MRPPSSIIALLALLCGCASRPVQRVRTGGELRNFLRPEAPEAIPEPSGRCRPSLRVQIIDAEGKPVRGARVLAEQTVSEHAAEETIATYLYRAEVLSDESGFARICDPSGLAPSSRWEGLGGGFSLRGKGQLLVASDGGVGLALPPFADGQRVLLWKPTWGPLPHP